MKDKNKAVKLPGFNVELIGATSSPPNPMKPGLLSNFCGFAIIVVILDVIAILAVYGVYKLVAPC